MGGGQKPMFPEGVMAGSPEPPGAFMSGDCWVSQGMPGRSTGHLSARRALEIYLEEAPPSPAELLVVESVAGQKEAADLVRR